MGLRVRLERRSDEVEGGRKEEGVRSAEQTKTGGAIRQRQRLIRRGLSSKGIKRSKRAREWLDL
jgi:hypothetical protein